MILLVSDLHLTDTTTIAPARLTQTLTHLLAHIEQLTAQALRERIRTLKLVLLGDIFELLKAQLWLTPQRLRPWQNPTPAHVRTVADIFEGICQQNLLFFEGLRAWQEKYRDRLGCEITYVPGNHDRLLNTEMGNVARQRLQELLPLQTDRGKPCRAGECFSEHFADPEHMLYAIHGHQHDPLNRYVGARAPVGDAVVIEFVLRFPLLVRAQLGIVGPHAALGFLDEMDDVYPQNLPALAHWLLINLQALFGSVLFLCC